MRTAIIAHPACRKHKMIVDHPECPERLDAIQDRLVASGVDVTIAHKLAPKATLAHIGLAHSEQHIAHILATLPQAGLADLDGDTWLCPESFLAIERAVGAGILAVDEILAGQLDAAFCAIRPPGHHANKDSSSGFCVVNNLAIAVKYAQTLGIKRIAILDIDVHHGNGTQDIFIDDESVLFCSLFQHPFYPNTAVESNNHIINSPMSAGQGAVQLKELVTQQWLPKLTDFNPELIFISAGFDAHLEDDMGGLGFVEADYVWFTEQVIALAKLCQSKGIISMLEGGYDLSSLGRSVTEHLRAFAHA
ncbi:histone deacetylase family protein [Pseudoalteromonas tunicata]|uniref:histone deacetylase family protein n=1 Tax=Pseudoalteromonas tunicata TaxID=314281 RepID=UPI0027401F41|nr:histone deacetylase family protein [Pseudoalteromonas tunicata]MDP4984132.1 histone deacetylase family protein [Pseudoalteromonas tunicata]MDP5211769.1 histone deacetylase family protein [Pseudoalteromonas tunicata]